MLAFYMGSSPPVHTEMLLPSRSSLLHFEMKVCFLRKYFVIIFAYFSSGNVIKPSEKEYSNLLKIIAVPSPMWPTQKLAMNFLP